MPYLDHILHIILFRCILLIFHANCCNYPGFHFIMYLSRLCFVAYSQLLNGHWYRIKIDNRSTCNNEKAREGALNNLMSKLRNFNFFTGQKYFPSSLLHCGHWETLHTESGSTLLRSDDVMLTRVCVIKHFHSSPPRCELERAKNHQKPGLT